MADAKVFDVKIGTISWLTFDERGRISDVRFGDPEPPIDSLPAIVQFVDEHNQAINERLAAERRDKPT